MIFPQGVQLVGVQCNKIWYCLQAVHITSSIRRLGGEKYLLMRFLYLSWMPLCQMSSTLGMPLINCCYFISQGIESLVVAEPSGIPLNLSNNADSRSFPFRNQPNYM